VRTNGDSAFVDNIVYDSGQVYDAAATAIQYPLTSPLAPDTTHYWRVRYQDNNAAWSEYSEETSFTTIPGIPDGAIAYWRFDDEGDSTASDIVSNNHGNLKIESGGSYTWVDGKSGKAINFNAAYMEILNESNLGQIENEESILRYSLPQCGGNASDARPRQALAWC